MFPLAKSHGYPTCKTFACGRTLETKSKFVSVHNFDYLSRSEMGKRLKRPANQPTLFSQAKRPAIGDSSPDSASESTVTVEDRPTEVSDNVNDHNVGQASNTELNLWFSY